MADKNDSNENSKENIQPLYFIYKTTNGMFLKDFDVCQAVLDVIDESDLMGVQRVGNLWRIYLRSLSARATLASTGVDIGGKHISLNTTNPYDLKNKQDEKPIKIMIQDVKMHITNEYVEKYLCGLGVKLTTPLSFVKIKDNNNENTPFINGNREAFGDAKYLREHPLPSFMLIGNCIARIKHFGQHPKASVCEKCFGEDHPVWRCRNGRACRVCRQTSHHEGTEMCPFYEHDNGCYAFGGTKDILSNFYPCNFTYSQIKYTTREQAYQHQKALFHNDKMVAEEIMKTTDPRQIKRLSKCIATKEAWKDNEMKCLYDVCFNAALQNTAYRDELLATGDALLVESVYGEYKWGSGLDSYCTAHTHIDKLPGLNEMGKILMNVRQRLQAIVKQAALNNGEVVNERRSVTNSESDERNESEMNSEFTFGYDDNDGVLNEDDDQTFLDGKTYKCDSKTTSKSKDRSSIESCLRDIDDKYKQICEGEESHTKNTSKDTMKKKRPHETISPDTVSQPNTKQSCNGPTPPYRKSKDKTRITKGGGGSQQSLISQFCKFDDKTNRTSKNDIHADFQDKSVW